MRCLTTRLVGISTDFSFDYTDFVDELARNPHLFDDSYTRWGVIQWMPPKGFSLSASTLQDGVGLMQTCRTGLV